MRCSPAVSMFTIALLGGGWNAASTSHAPPPETRSFLFVQGTDSGGESFTRTAGSLTGDMSLGKKYHVHYEGQVLSDGTIPKLDVRYSVPSPHGTTERAVSVVIGRERAHVMVHRGSKIDSISLASEPGIVPVINPSMAMLELVIQRARAQKVKSTTVPVLSVDEGSVGNIAVTFLTPTTVVVGSLSGATDQMRVVIDAGGRVQSARSGADAKDHFTMLLTSKPRPGK